MVTATEMSGVGRGQMIMHRKDAGLLCVRAVTRCVSRTLMWSFDSRFSGNAKKKTWPLPTTTLPEIIHRPIIYQMCFIHPWSGPMVREGLSLVSDVLSNERWFWEGDRAQGRGCLMPGGAQ
jgi:hypothetical protein